MTPSKINFKVYQGSTFNEVIRWEDSKKVYIPITNITQAAPCVVTAPIHGLPTGWGTKITNVGGMVEINSEDTYHIVTKLTSDTIEINALKTLGYRAYTSGGVLEYNKPMDITGYTARMQIREKNGSNRIITDLTTENAGIIMDPVGCGIVINIGATTTAEYDFTSAIYGLEVASPTGTVYNLANGMITLIKEITK